MFTEEGFLMTSPTCSSGCLTQDHKSWGECIRSKGLRVAYSGIGGQDATAQKKWDADLDAYRSAVAQGMQPETTRRKDVLQAEKFSDAVGLPYSDEVAQAVVTNTLLERSE